MDLSDQNMDYIGNCLWILVMDLWSGIVMGLAFLWEGVKECCNMWRSRVICGDQWCLWREMRVASSKLPSIPAGFWLSLSYMYSCRKTKQKTQVVRASRKTSYWQAGRPGQSLYKMQLATFKMSFNATCCLSSLCLNKPWSQFQSEPLDDIPLHKTIQHLCPSK